ncbi:ankyrin repeat-containing domain protein, partial [Baffinella frigidus]
SCFYDAVWGGRTELVRRLIKDGADVNERNGSSGDTALRVAVIRGNNPIISILLLNEADPDRGTSNGTSPMHMAAWKGSVQQAQMLIAGAADVSIVTNAGFTPLDYALRPPSVEMIRLLLNNGAFVDAQHPVTGATTLRHAVQATQHRPLASRAAIGLLIEQGANVSAADIHGVTPLHITAIEKNRELLSLLLEKRAQYSTR